MKNKTKILFGLVVLSVFISVITFSFTYNFYFDKVFLISELIWFTDRKQIELDNNGIPYLKDHYIRWELEKSYYNPVTIIHYWMDKIDINNYTNNELIEIWDWLIQNTEIINEVWSFIYDWWNPIYFKNNNRWYSWMANWEWIELLLNIYKITWDIKYLNHIDILLNSFLCTDETYVKTCVNTFLDWEYHWYLEYHQDWSVKPYTLNWFIFSILWIYKFYEFSWDLKAKQIFENAIITLKLNLYKFENIEKNTTMYDLIWNYANKYHFTHIKQLNDLYEITNDDLFLEYSIKWNNMEQIENRSLKRFNLVNYSIIILSTFLYLVLLLFIYIIFTKLKKDEKIRK